LEYFLGNNQCWAVLLFHEKPSVAVLKDKLKQCQFWVWFLKKNKNLGFSSRSNSSKIEKKNLLLILVPDLKIRPGSCMVLGNLDQNWQLTFG
jgi:hypothetical protein